MYIRQTQSSFKMREESDKESLRKRKYYMIDKNATMENEKSDRILRLGLLGERLGHSLSPEIHADLLEQQQVDGSYQLYAMPRKEAAHILDFMKENRITGMNVTIPYKELVSGLVDVLDTHAKKIGAVNTIFLKDGVSYGYNTDYIGAVTMFERAGISLKDKQIVILGSGGACRALIYGFYLEGAAGITIAARNQAAREELKRQFPYLEICGLDEISSGDILVNTTPVGMFPNVGKSPVTADTIRQFSVAADIVYNPLMTEFLRIAETEGLQVVTGLRMLVNQAIGSEEIWLEKELDYSMGDGIHEELAKRF